MKSKEERAYEHYPIKRIGLPAEIAASEEGWEGYIKGATEQEAITKKETVEKVWNVLFSHFNSDLPFDKEWLIKAMEE